MRIIRNALKSIRNPYRVIVLWRGTLYFHRASTTNDALGWMKCYPVDASVVIFRRFSFGIVAKRYAA